MVERAHEPGKGVAYSTRRPEHLLNVPARRMSALADDPDHFTRWFAARTGGDAEAFAPRMLYGDYLAELLRAADVGIVRGEAVALVGNRLTLADGSAIEADAVILAPGNFKPARPRGILPETLGAAWIGDPWSANMADGLDRRDVVLLLGTGLTAVDAALTLDATGFEGRIVALSRRGLAPRSHGLREPATGAIEALPADCLAMLGRVRARSEAVDWRTAVHELRPVTQALWRTASLVQRRRFLRHLRPWWDVHRHRLAPAVGARIAAMQAAGKLTIAAARLISAAPDDGGARIRFRPRGQAAIETLRVARIVNCTGPEAGIGGPAEALLASLHDVGRIRADPLGLGIDVEENCRTIGHDGAASSTLFAIGPPTRGAFWESVAVPDIRAQAARVAALLAG